MLLRPPSVTRTDTLVPNSTLIRPHVRRRRDRQEASDFVAAHQQLHADPRAEAEARDPRRLRLGMDRLHPVERRGGVAQFADAIVERALAAADAAEVEAQHRETARDEALDRKSTRLNSSH